VSHLSIEGMMSEVKVEVRINEEEENKKENKGRK
jgi:hypothetical protein